MIRTQIQLTEEQAKAIKTLAMKRNTSVAELIRRSVDELLQKAVGADLAERRRRALAAAGRFHSGKTDISRNHDDYLAEAYRE
ncbi:MAG: ribbon-helix-helix protein, CopG family [Ardenticatenales bacterium]|nr:ribbon-helix-helix protein, CopG family [Ardenticatenales bacterium]